MSASSEPDTSRDPDRQPAPSARFPRLRRAYLGAALFAWNLIVLLVLLNVALAIGYRWRDGPAPSNPVFSKYGKRVAGLYPGMTEAEVGELLEETWSRPFVYDPVTQFRERPYRGRYVNVDPAGFRHGAAQGPWPPRPENYNVYVFGGSTTFGYGVPDARTIPSRLQQHLGAVGGRPVKAYNFAAGLHFSSQERAQLQRLLLDGPVPDAAVFIDGLNEFYNVDGVPFHTSDLDALFAEATEGPPARGLARRLFERTPLGRLAGDVRSLRSSAPSPEMVVRYDDVPLLDAAIRRYLGNRSQIIAVARDMGIPTLFVWQPVPTFAYDDRTHPLVRSGDFGRHSYSRFGYALMARDHEELRHQLGFLWCAELHRGRDFPIFVDSVHYSAQMSDLLGSHIAGAWATHVER